MTLKGRQGVVYIVRRWIRVWFGTKTKYELMIAVAGSSDFTLISPCSETI